MGEQRITINHEELDYRCNESFKSLRSNIQFCGDDIKVISLTSCTPNEGKTSIAFNLAKSFSEIDKKVIFIDADLRKSVLMGRYKVGVVKGGLSHYLSGQRKLDEVICQSNIDNLDVIFCGSYSPNPAELLEHTRFDNMIKRLRDEYDYVIVDTPPLGSVIDSAIVAKEADGSIIVVEANAISYKFAQNVKEQLSKTGCRILGVILNKVPLENHKYYGKYYAKYYGKY